MANDATRNEYVVWQGSPGQARGLENIWSYLDHFDDHRPGRVHYQGRPDLLVSVPPYEPDRELSLEPGGAGDVAFRAANGRRVEVLAYSEDGLEILRQLGWPELEVETQVEPSGNGHPGIERMRRLQEEGRLVTLPAPMDPPEVRYSMAHQEFYVLDGMVISNQLCTHCDLCQAVCPPRALEEVDGRIRMTGDCVTGACGLCYMSCPQMYWQLWMQRNPERPATRPALGGFGYQGTLEQALAELKDSLARRFEGLRWETFELEKLAQGYLAGLAKAARKARAAGAEKPPAAGKPVTEPADPGQRRKDASSAATAGGTE